MTDRWRHRRGCSGRRRSRRSRSREQAGVTLIELLLGIALTAIIIGPLAAWTISTVRQQGMAGDLLSNAVSTGRVGATFTADVASARTVTAVGTLADCAGGPGAGGNVRLSLLSAGATTTRIVYSEARPEGAAPSSPERSLWRRECADTGGTTAAEVFPDIRPGSVVARCPLPAPAPSPPATAPPVPVSDCSHPSAERVQLSVTPDGPSESPRPVVLSATRRADAGSIGVPGSGNRPPIAQVQVDALVGYVGVPFRFSGPGSEDLDGPLVESSYRWEFPGPGGAPVVAIGSTVDHAFGEVGEHTVVLQVTDAEGAINVAAVTVRVVNRHPNAAATVTPETGEVGVTQFHFDATGSDDGDADTLVYRWDLGPDAAGDPIVDSRAEFDFVFPAGAALGPRRITLTVDDPRGGRDVRVLQVGLGGPAPISGIIINPEPVVTGAVPVVGTIGPGRPDLSVSFSLLAGDPTASAWRLATAAGASVATGPGATLDHVFGVGEHGEYRISRVAPNGQVVGAERSFRVNAAPIAVFSTSGGSTDSPRTVDFSVVGSSDPDGSIVAWRWTFGFFAAWTSSDPAPTHVFTHPGRYQVRLEVVDSDGATNSAVQDVQVTGPIQVPAAPAWQGDQVTIVAVPGAEAYRVQVRCDGAPVAVTGSEVPASAAPVLAVPPGTCAATAVAAATYELRAAGVWSPTSPPGVRP